MLFGELVCCRGRDAVGDLLDAAEAADASLIVVGIRHRSPMGKLLLGSAALAVVVAGPGGPAREVAQIGAAIGRARGRRG